MIGTINNVNMHFFIHGRGQPTAHARLKPIFTAERSLYFYEPSSLVLDLPFFLDFNVHDNYPQLSEYWAKLYQ